MGDSQLRAVAVKGPDPRTDNVVRWRCVDLRDEVKRRFSVTVHENTIGVWLRRMGLTRLQPRPFHPKKDPQDPQRSAMPRPLQAMLRLLQNRLGVTQYVQQTAP